MAKQKVNKSQAVRDYLKNNPKAKNREVSDALKKTGIKISPNYVYIVKRLAKKAAAKPAASPARQAPAAEPAAAAKPGDMITLEQIKKVAQTVKAIGGFDRLKELLEVVREVGGLRRFKELLEAMSVAEAGETRT